MKFYKIKKSGNSKKETALKWLSLYVRRRDAIKTTGDIYYARCVTCDKAYPVEDMDAGHGIPGRMNAILFNEELVRAQCRNCNRKGGGELQMFKRVLIDENGQEKWDYWQSTKNDPVKYTDFDYEQIAKMFKQKYKQLEGL